MRRLLPLLLLVLVPAPPAAHADGCPLPCSGQSASPLGSKLLFVQPNGSRGPLVVYDTRTRKPAFSLPPGIASADGQDFFAVQTDRRGNWLYRYYAPDGELINLWRQPGRWELGGVSPQGRWVALTRRRGATTTVRIFDVDRGKVVHKMRLHGRFEVETISGDGKRLFLIQHLRRKRYNVRQYDLSRERLVARPLRAAGVKLMVGYAWSGVASPDGHWLLTLYLSTARNTAFVHSLDLRRSHPACVNLPSGRGRFDTLKNYSLSLTPESDVLFAANPTLGVVAEVDLHQSRVFRVTRFPRSAARVSAPRAATLSTISRDSRTLYFSAGRDLWAFDAAYGLVRGPYPTGGEIVGVGYGARDRRIFAVRKDGRMLAFNAATGGRIA
jgi:WD40 repeat protein